MARRCVARGALGLAAALAVAAPSPTSASGRPDAARRAAAYLASRQFPTGAFFSASAPADVVAEALAALVAGGGSGTAVERALGYLQAAAPSRAAERAAYAGRIVMGIVAGGADPRRFGGTDYVQRLQAFYNPATGAYETEIYDDALALLGVLAAGERPPDQALVYLRAAQCPGGGFSDAPGCVSAPADADTTALVLNVLAGAGIPPQDGARTRARAFLRSAQNRDGGFGHHPGEETNANSTGLALAAIAALGEDPLAPPWRQEDGANPLDRLVALQDTSGGVRWKASDPRPNDYATVQAVAGLAGVPYPVRPPAGAPAVPGGSPGPGAAPTPRPPAPSGRPQASPPTSPPTPTPSAGRGGGQAALVVRTPARLRTACVAFSEPSITGDELLARAGLDVAVEASAQGLAVCRLDATGCDAPRERCFCRYPVFWHYFTREPGERGWRFSEVGASVRRVLPGAADAWVWTDGTLRPPPVSFESVCGGGASPLGQARGGGGSTNLAALGAMAGTLAAAGVALALRRSRA